ncbi:mesencephalic astrocyte-derived neurotrophic factor [Perkinsela sp. CCAP 1560/4]|nr:mesencephalic astrocyte-derived neurotrophic factor [Perkinsela sp. CCAP 1560/4]|eukprot:KNH07643.1 mesencephalic astrocyte-derived neurotrophic factor [Perkinsela sp. CCAP 1560/4]
MSFPALLAVSILACHAAHCITDDEIRKMKMKELKEFLDDRDESCSGCVEKGDFVRIAIEVKDKKISQEKQKMKGYTGEYPKKSFWDFWTEESLQIAASSELDTKGRKLIADAVETCFMQYGKSVATKLKKGPAELLKTSLKSPYYQAGIRGIQKLITLCASSPSLKNAELQNACEKEFVPWITNVGIENTNPMYEILEQMKSEL